MPGATSVTVRAPAKINLQLAVGGPRPDGFHDVATVLQAVSLYDEVTVIPADARITCTVTGDEAAGVPLGEDNLAVRAAELLAQRTGVTTGVSITIRKEIPVGGGMAGGSADAAATLLACDSLWGTALDRSELLGLCAHLGSDVPFPLFGGTAVGTGRGERLTAALTRGSYDWVLALADGELSAAAVYAETDRLRSGRLLLEPRVGDALMAALRAADTVALGQALGNDLQPAACSLRPALRETVAAGLHAGALGALVSGSGPTCAFLARNSEHGRELARAMAESGTCRAVRRCVGPVPGARVVDGGPG